MTDLCQIDTPQAMQELGMTWRRTGRTVGLVPTMGYLHEGHLSLMRWAREQCDTLVVSIFVNPTQFGPGEDFDKYPCDIPRDAALAAACGVDVLFLPRKDEIYAADHGTWVNVPDLTRALCGRSRPVHFQGVATVVCKLFNLIQPSFAVFGQKDWQQLAVIRKMTRELNLPVRIEGRPTVREADGLAMSSRNVYLSPQERAVAPHLQQGLCLLEDLVRGGERHCPTLCARIAAYYAQHIPDGRLDYLELVDPERIAILEDLTGDCVAAVAMHLGRARLIDNRYISTPI